jgi:glycosyltransferase involved in cell wall biosynthesis
MNEDDAEALKRSRGRDSLILRHHIIIPELATAEKPDPPMVIWVGSMSKVKQPELFVRLAAEMPDVSFRMIGGTGNEPGNYEKIKAACEELPNIRFMGSVWPFHAIDKYYAEARILVNTAVFESYPPYAVLQAWANYAPIVTLNSNDSADRVMRDYSSGFHSGSFDRLKEDVRRLLEDEPLRRRMGENGRRYVEEHHDIRKIARQHIELFNSLLNPK